MKQVREDESGGAGADDSDLGAEFHIVRTDFTAK
jgi:hypothetical protein